ncbi:MAG: aspartate kinase [Candidatus Bathyarchaeota archaeon]|nr:MAG: aspartate kinase [Candidatus Bathyarchaeota archaeon]
MDKQARPNPNLQHGRRPRPFLEIGENPVGNRVVIKFGGAILSNGEKIQHAAKMVAEAPYKEIVVVVSAMGKMTDSLVNTVSQIGNINDADYAEIISMGERTSARIFSSALKKIGAKAEPFDPANDNWPIITNSNFRDAVPDVEKTTLLAQKFLAPLLGTAIPVVCGFLGKDSNGNVTTLGRGGSDTTAVLLAKCLNADEVILVKETSGVLSADPKIVPEARPLNKLDIHEMFDLAQGGAKIVKPEALKYKLPNQTLRIIDFSSGSFVHDGTEIIGSFTLNSAEISSHEGLLAINVVCEVNTKNLKEIFQALSQNPVYGVSSGGKSITVFTSDGKVNEVINRLHRAQCFKAISHRENVAMLQMIHPMFIDSPGGVAKISSALSQHGINIIEITTSKATINIFIEESQLKRAKEAISNVFEP